MQELMIPTDDERTWATLAHISSFAAPVLGPLIILLIYQERSKFVRYHALQALLMSGLLTALSVVVMIVVVFISILTCGVGSILGVFFPFLTLIPLYEAWRAWQGDWETLPGISEFGR